MNPTTVIIADDHAIFLEKVGAMLPELGLEVLTQCADGSTALEGIRSLKPDFAILNLHMPGLSGLQVVRKLRESDCPTRCIIFTSTGMKGPYARLSRSARMGMS